MVYRLQKSLYGQKQAPKEWNVKLADVLVQNGCIQSLHDYSLFTKKKKDGCERVALLIYVDETYLKS